MRLARTEDVLASFTSGTASDEVVDALVSFTRKHRADFDVLMAFALAEDAGPYAAVAAVLQVVFDEVKEWDALAESLAKGESSEMLAVGTTRYADAVLRLDEWLLERGRRKPEPRDEYGLVWNWSNKGLTNGEDEFGEETDEES